MAILRRWHFLPLPAFEKNSHQFYMSGPYCGSAMLPAVFFSSLIPNTLNLTLIWLIYPLVSSIWLTHFVWSLIYSNWLNWFYLSVFQFITTICIHFFIGWNLLVMISLNLTTIYLLVLKLILINSIFIHSYSQFTTNLLDFISKIYSCWSTYSPKSYIHFYWIKFTRNDFTDYYNNLFTCLEINSYQPNIDSLLLTIHFKLTWFYLKNSLLLVYIFPEILHTFLLDQIYS